MCLVMFFVKFQGEVAYFSFPFSFDLLYVNGPDHSEGESFLQHGFVAGCLKKCLVNFSFKLQVCGSVHLGTCDSNSGIWCCL